MTDITFCIGESLNKKEVCLDRANCYRYIGLNQAQSTGKVMRSIMVMPTKERFEKSCRYYIPVEWANK